MPKYTVDLDVLRHAVLDHSLSQVGGSLLHAQITEPVRIGALAFTPTAALAVRVVNGVNDKDDDAVIAADGDAHIPFDAQSAWLKYKMSLKADGRLGFAAAAASQKTAVDLSEYRIHAATESAWDALTSDLRSPRSLLDLEDVKRLQPGEALAMELGGAISASVSFPWADAISTKWTDLVQANVPLVLKLRSGLEAFATVKVTDHFFVVISRTREGNYRIAVKKASSRDHALGIEVSLGGEATAVPAIEEALAHLFEAVTGVAIEDEKALGYERVKRELRERLEKIARWKAATGFAYEYARIAENESIADFILLDDAHLARDYELALSGDFAAIVDHLRKDVGTRAVVRYLNQSTLTRRSTSGFSLGIGKWIDVRARDESAFKQTTRTSLDGFRLVTSRGTRRYEERRIPQNDYEWIVDLKAQMSEFAATPTSREFDYGLQYAVTLERRSLSEDDLARMLDFAAIWDVCAPSPELLAEVLHQKGIVKVQLVLDHDELAATLAAFPTTVDASWAAPLAMALPYLSTFAERRTFASRREIYEPAWRAWLEGEEISLRQRIHSGLILFEERTLPGSFAWNAGTGHPHLRSRLESFMRGARRLYDAMTTAQAPEVIGTAYDSLEGLWSQRLYIAASGRYLLDRARDAGVEVNRSLTIEVGEKTLIS